MLTAQQIAQIQQFMTEFHTPNRRDRWYHHENFAQRPVNEAALDLTFSTGTQAQQRVYSAANRNFMYSGTNAQMLGAGSTFAANGGVLLTTAGGDNDQQLLSPAAVNSAATFITAIGGTTGTSTPTSPFLTTNAPIMEAVIELPTITSIRFVCGLKMTTDPTTATDDHKAMFAFDTASAVSASRFRLVTSNATDWTPDDIDTEAKANSTTQLGIVAANTKYVLTVGILPTSRIPFFAINGVPVGPAAPALITGCGLAPVIGIQALTGSARSMVVRSVTLSRSY